MNLWSRLARFAANVLGSSANDDREGHLRKSAVRFDLRRHQEAHRRVRQDLLEFSAARVRLEAQIERLNLRTDRAQERAQRAVVTGQDEQVRFLVRRRRAALQQIESLDVQLSFLLADERRLFRRERILGLRVEKLRQHHRTLIAQKASNPRQLRLASTPIAPASSGSTGDQWREVNGRNNTRSA